MEPCCTCQFWRSPINSLTNEWGVCEKATTNGRGRAEEQTMFYADGYDGGQLYTNEAFGCNQHIPHRSIDEWKKQYLHTTT